MRLRAAAVFWSLAPERSASADDWVCVRLLMRTASSHSVLSFSSQLQSATLLLSAALAQPHLSLHELDRLVRRGICCVCR